MKVVVVGGGIAGLAAARQLESLLRGRDRRRRADRAPGRKAAHRARRRLRDRGRRGQLPLAQGARCRACARSSGSATSSSGGSRRTPGASSASARELHRAARGAHRDDPDESRRARAESRCCPTEGRERLAAEVDIPPAPPGGDESIASFVTRRLGREAYERWSSRS